MKNTILCGKDIRKTFTQSKRNRSFGLSFLFRMVRQEVALWETGLY